MSTQGPDGKGRDLWTRLGKTIRAGAETIVQETKDITQIGKLRLDLMRLENERGRKFEDVGRSAHTLYKTGATMPPELYELLQAVDETESRIEEKKQEIDKVRSENDAEAQKAQETVEGQVFSEVGSTEDVVENKIFCRHCGSQLNPGDNFCPRCGTKL